jgi:hypothetical protein
VGCGKQAQQKDSILPTCWGRPQTPKTQNLGGEYAAQEIKNEGEMHLQNRKRPLQLIVRVTQDEKALINKKMEAFGTTNFNTYARKMLLNGYVLRVDMEQFQLLALEVNKIGTNINQIAKVANTTGVIMGDDISQVKEMINEIWQLLKSSLSTLLSKTR